MSHELRQPTARSSAILIGIIVLLVAAAVVGAVVLRQPGSSNNSKNHSNSTQVNATDEPVNIAIDWPSFSSPYRITVPLPRGMKPCLEEKNVFAVRNDECSSKTEPSFRFRRDDGWDGKTSLEIFDGVFAQDLREVGLATIRDKAAPVTAKNVDALIYRMNDQRTLVTAVERTPPAGSKSRGVAIEVYRLSVPTLDGVKQDVDAVLTAILQGLRFSIPRASAPVNDSGQ